MSPQMERHSITDEKHKGLTPIQFAIAKVAIAETLQELEAMGALHPWQDARNVTRYQPLRDTRESQESEVSE